VSTEEAAEALASSGGEAKAAIRELLAKNQRRVGPPTRLGVRAALVAGRLVPGDVEVVDGRIAGYGLPSAGGRGIATPGFVDLQVNGFGGVDFLDADTSGYARAGEALLETGVTAYLPTLITAPEEMLIAALAEIHEGDRGRPDPRRARRGPLHLSAEDSARTPPDARRRSRPGAARAAARRRDRYAPDTARHRAFPGRARA
jgi:hypothetical protein